jgi:uncharacterized membrane protein
MSKDQFMKELEARLIRIPEEERKHIIQIYEELFQRARENGKDENQIAMSLGFPNFPGYTDQIAEDNVPTKVNAPTQAYPTYPVPQSDTTLRMVVAGIGLALFNLIFILGPLLGLAGAIAGLWAFPLATILASVVTVVIVLFQGEPLNMAFGIFSSLVIGGIGTLVGLGLLFITKWFIKGIVAYVKLNIRIIKGA